MDKENSPSSVEESGDRSKKYSNFDLCSHSTDQRSTDGGPLLAKTSVHSKIWKSVLNHILKNRYQIALAMSAMILVFSVSLWYFLNVASTTSLALTVDNSHCKPFKSVYNLQSQEAYSKSPFNMIIPSTTADDQSNNYTYVEMIGQWKSCSISATSETTPHLLDCFDCFHYMPHSKNFTLTSSSDNMNRSGDAMLVRASVVVGGEFIYTERIKNVNDQSTSNDDYIVAVGSDDSNTTTNECFVLECIAHYLPGYNQYGLDSYATVTNANPNGIIKASITKADNSVTAQCTAVLYGTVIPFFTVSNSIQLSDSGQCTSFYTTYSAISLSLPFALTTLSILKVVFYFAGEKK